MCTTTEMAPTLSCRICLSSHIKFHFNIRGERLWRCQNCGFVQVENKPSEESLAAIYSENYFKNAKYRGDISALEKEDSRRLNLLKHWVPQGAEVLDAGCSTGDFVVHAKREYAMYGIDYSDFAIKTALERNPELSGHFQSGRLENSNWTDKKFNAICLWDVIEHIWDPVPVLSDLLLRVKPGGIIALSTPAIDSFMARVLGRYWPFLTPPEHLGFFSWNAFEAVVQRVGNCEIIYYNRFGKWANVAFIAYKIARIAPRWFPISLLWPLRQWPLKYLSIYVPTQDIYYIVLRKSPDVLACSI